MTTVTPVRSHGALFVPYCKNFCINRQTVCADRNIWSTLMWLWQLAFRRAHRDRGVTSVEVLLTRASINNASYLSLTRSGSLQSSAVGSQYVCEWASRADPLFLWSPPHRQHFYKCARQQKCIHFYWQQCQRTKHEIVTSSPVLNARLSFIHKPQSLTPMQ